jgi:hypothetical protein
MSLDFLLVKDGKFPEILCHSEISRRQVQSAKQITIVWNVLITKIHERTHMLVLIVFEFSGSPPIRAFYLLQGTQEVCAKSIPAILYPNYRTEDVLKNNR